MKKQLLITCALLLVTLKIFSAPINLSSPDKRIKVSVDLKEKISYSVSFNDAPFLADCYLQLNLDLLKLGTNPKLLKKNTFDGEYHFKPGCSAKE